MLGKERYLLLVSDSTHAAIKIESILKELKLDGRIVPLPGELKASCGLSVKCKIEDIDEIKGILKEENLEISCYEVEKDGLKKNYKKL